MHRLYLPLILKTYAPSAALASEAAPAATGSPALDGTIIVTETVISYGYDFANRLLGVTKVVTVTVDGAPQVTTEALSSTYDALGRQVNKQTESGAVHYLYAGGQVIEERDEADGILVTYAGRLIMDRGGSRFFYQADALGSIRALADDAGSIVERVDYDPFGAPIFSGAGSESSVGNPYLFRGRRYDAESGLYVYGGRRYDPATGRYVQRGREYLGNRYTFAGNNPINHIPR